MFEKNLSKTDYFKDLSYKKIEKNNLNELENSMIYFKYD